MVLAILFGLAPNYYLAILIRTFWGFTNGNLGVLKTYVSEVCSEDMQSLGFSIIVTMGGISKLLLFFFFILVWWGRVLEVFLEMLKRIFHLLSWHSHGFVMYVFIEISYVASTIPSWFSQFYFICYHFIYGSFLP